MTTKRNTKPARLWVGIIPGIFGYGINTIGRTEAGVMKTLRRSYDEFKKAYPDDSTTFETSFQYWGGYVTEVELGEDYYDGFCK